MGRGVIDSLDGHVRRIDEDRWLAARFAPAPARARLTALYAFHHEIAKVGEIVSEPMLGEVRLAWWREALDGLYGEGPARRHEVADAMDAAFAPRPPRALLDAMIDARMRDLDKTPFADVEALAAYAEATAGGVMRAGAALCVGEPVSDEADAAIAAMGRAWGLAGLARAFAPLAARGRAPVPEDARVEAGLRRSALDAGTDPAAAAGALAPVLAAADEAYREARARRGALPAAAWPAIGYVALAPGYLRALRRPGRDPYRDRVEVVRVARQLRLVAAAATGRI